MSAIRLGAILTLVSLLVVVGRGTTLAGPHPVPDIPFPIPCQDPDPIPSNVRNVDGWEFKRTSGEQYGREIMSNGMGFCADATQRSLCCRHYFIRR